LLDASIQYDPFDGESRAAIAHVARGSCESAAALAARAQLHELRGDARGALELYLQASQLPAHQTTDFRARIWLAIGHLDRDANDLAAEQWAYHRALAAAPPPEAENHRWQDCHDGRWLNCVELHQITHRLLELNLGDIEALRAEIKLASGVGNDQAIHRVLVQLAAIEPALAEELELTLARSGDGSHRERIQIDAMEETRDPEQVLADGDVHETPPPAHDRDDSRRLWQGGLMLAGGASLQGQSMFTIGGFLRHTLGRQRRSCLIPASEPWLTSVEYSVALERNSTATVAIESWRHKRVGPMFTLGIGGGIRGGVRFAESMRDTDRIELGGSVGVAVGTRASPIELGARFDQWAVGTYELRALATLSVRVY